MFTSCVSRVITTVAPNASSFSLSLSPTLSTTLYSGTRVNRPCVPDETFFFISPPPGETDSFSEFALDWWPGSRPILTPESGFSPLPDGLSAGLSVGFCDSLGFGVSDGSAEVSAPGVKAASGCVVLTGVGEGVKVGAGVSGAAADDTVTKGVLAPEHAARDMINTARAANPSADLIYLIYVLCVRPRIGLPRVKVLCVIYNAAYLCYVNTNASRKSS